MRRRAVSLVSAVALPTVTVALCITSTALSTPACRIRSVNEKEYVAANRAILDRLPVYPSAKRMTTYSIPQTATDSCLPTENGPPYDAYWTYDTYTLPPKGRPIVSAPWKVPDKYGNTRVPARVPSVLVYYDRKLRERGWKRQVWSGCCEMGFKRGAAFLDVRVGLNLNDPYKRPPFYQLSLDHDE